MIHFTKYIVSSGISFILPTYLYIKTIDSFEIYSKNDFRTHFIKK